MLLHYYVIYIIVSIEQKLFDEKQNILIEVVSPPLPQVHRQFPTYS